VGGGPGTWHQVGTSRYTPGGGQPGTGPGLIAGIIVRVREQPFVLATR
jgi:hypothetical protein